MTRVLFTLNFRKDWKEDFRFDELAAFTRDSRSCGMASFWWYG